MAIGVYRIAGVRLPHPPVPVHLLLIVEQAIAEAWKRLKRNPPSGFDIATAPEDVVTFHLHDVLVNDIYRRRRVPGFVRETFNPPQREPKVCSFDRGSIDKMPDLRIDLVDRPLVTLLTNDGLFIECKPIDGNHSVPGHYCRKGLRRFVVGEYGWAMPEGMMVAYVAASHQGPRATPLAALRTALEASQQTTPDEFATLQMPTQCPIATARRAPVIAWITRHRRQFNYVQTGGPAPELLLRHLWLKR
ncbi:MAG: hypothetical protein WC378_07705 [Opitutaceae bacterium]|jgi:hypothetical protein